MNTTLEQVKPKTIARLEAQAKRSGLSIDEYLQSLLSPDELALKADVDEPPVPQSLAEESAADREVKRQKAIAWIKSHSKEYSEMYVALDGDKLIGTGKRYGDALKLALQAGYQKAFIGYVYPENYVGYWGGWD